MSILFKVLRDLVGSPRQRASEPAATNDEVLRVFIGYDPRQNVAYNVLQHSLFTRCSEPVAITPLVLESLPMTRQGLTPFTYSRFLVPWLMGYRGFGLFLDLDMLLRGDISNVFEFADSQYAVQVVKNSQRFEWASAILFNCAHPANALLTPAYVDNADACQSPHLFDWLDESLIGALPPQWNHTVGYDNARPDAQLVHFTQGVPAHPEVAGCEFHSEWVAERDAMCTTQGWTELMGHSVHAKTLADGSKVPKLQGSNATIPSNPQLGALQATDATTSEAKTVRGSRETASDRFHDLVELYKDMHQRGDTLNEIPAEQTFDGRSLVAHVGKIREIVDEFGAKTLLDYGCGKALAYGRSYGLPDGSQVLGLKDLWHLDDIRLYDPGYEPYSALPEGTYDGVICTDVLEHVPEEDVRWILGEMFAYANKFLYLTISCRLAVKHLPTGENAHITVFPPDWWDKVLRQVAVKHPEVRFFATCYGHGEQPVILRG